MKDWAHLNPLHLITWLNSHLFSPTPATPSPPLPNSLSMSLSTLLASKSARGSGDIGKWDGRMFKLELVFISCLISWRLSPWLSAANLCDLSEACRQEQRTERTHRHTHKMHIENTCSDILCYIQNSKSVINKRVLFNLDRLTHLLEPFINKQCLSTYMPLVLDSGHWVCHVSQRVYSM